MSRLPLSESPLGVLDSLLVMAVTEFGWILRPTFSTPLGFHLDYHGDLSEPWRSVSGVFATALFVPLPWAAGYSTTATDVILSLSIC